jgi:hypothetical protein
MTTRRQFMQSIPAAGAAFAVAGRVMLDGSPATAREAATAEGHFHPKGKAPSKHTLAILKQARGQRRIATAAAVAGFAVILQSGRVTVGRLAREEGGPANDGTDRHLVPELCAEN